ncbi:hypothetical protein MIND_00909500 [Mycena indigotica]|uniref:Uncharacterized protein n=1 Tax=Mycena indigotica TaxID=2126181 RepID=A0A8H6SFA7_9AGAR|nr:uncharacterized protein MIND_00909500 [Mycena indigotica]KAF7296785.1 hypothetical protein MIND_00909500 [Mycena indigotica]
MEAALSPDFPPGSLSIHKLCLWLKSCDSAIQNCIVTDICWWAESDTVLKHQSLVLRFWYQGTAHDLVLERAGKAIWRPFRSAIDTGTFKTVDDTKNEVFWKSHRLLFALVANRDILPKNAFSYKAFVDFLDYKWSGPPLTLGLLPQYLKAISEQAPRYSLASKNCYWFARLVFHILAIRHYSFPLVASSIRPRTFVIPRTTDNTVNGTADIVEADWQHHDPSSISLVLRFLHYEEWRNGILMFRRMAIGTTVLLSLTIIGATGYGFSLVGKIMRRNASDTAASQRVATVNTFFLGFVAQALVVLPACIILGPKFVRWLVRALTRLLVRQGTLKAVKLFESADPESARGDYIPPMLPFSLAKKGPPRYLRRSGNFHQEYTMRIHRTKREMPQPWTNDKQVYEGTRPQYLRSLAKLRAEELEEIRSTRPPRRDVPITLHPQRLAQNTVPSIPSSMQ